MYVRCCRYPLVLQQDVKHFFCKYNDPIYIKLEKCQILTALVNSENSEQVCCVSISANECLTGSA